MCFHLTCWIFFHRNMENVIYFLKVIINMNNIITPYIASDTYYIESDRSLALWENFNFGCSTWGKKYFCYDSSYQTAYHIETKLSNNITEHKYEYREHEKQNNYQEVRNDKWLTWFWLRVKFMTILLGIFSLPNIYEFIFTLGCNFLYSFF